MAKKDFSNIDIAPVYNALEEATAEPAQEAQEEKKPRKDRKTPTEQEATELLFNMRTSGHKGLKLPRINLAFAPDCYDYVLTMSRARGETMTEFINLIIRDHKAKHGDIYEKALEFRKMLEGK
jgi:hypothetical protein